MRIFPKVTSIVMLAAIVSGPLPACAQGIITTVAGNGTPGFSGDGGPATSAAFRGSDGVAVDRSGNLYIVDSGNSRIRKVSLDGTISTVAGIGPDAFTGTGFSGDGGPAISAKLAYPSAVAIDPAGNLYIADTYNHRIRKVTLDGIIHTIAGNGQLGYSSGGFSGDGGPAIAAQLNTPRGLAVDAAGNLYIADIYNNRIRKVTPNGIITTVAGTGVGGFSGDGGQATNAQLLAPGSVAVDLAGNLYIAESWVDTFDAPPAPGNHRIRKVTPDGIITTIAGNGNGSFYGDGGPATSAALCFPEGIAVDLVGNLYITDSGNNRIRQVDLTGTITTIAGGGTSDPEGGYSGDGGPAIRAALDLSTKDYVKAGGNAVLDSAGNLYIADNGRIRKVTLVTFPDLPAGSAVNAASFAPGKAVAPGSLVSVFGHYLALDPQQAALTPLPKVINKSSVTVAGINAPLLYVSPSQINIQVPFEVPLGTATIAASTSNGTSPTSLTVAAVSPGIFTVDSSGTGQGSILTSTGEFAAAAGSVPGQQARPARRGEVISIYATGLGDVSNRPISGAAAAGPPALAETLLRPIVRIGGVAVDADFSGLAPNFVGLYQVNVKIPAGTLIGNSVPLVLEIGGVDSNTVTLAVQ